MIKLMNIGNPNNRTHQVATRDVFSGGRKVSEDRTEKRPAVGLEGKESVAIIKHTGITLIEPNRVHCCVTDKLGAQLKKYPEIIILEEGLPDPKKG